MPRSACSFPHKAFCPCRDQVPLADSHDVPFPQSAHCPALVSCDSDDEVDFPQSAPSTRSSKIAFLFVCPQPTPRLVVVVDVLRGMVSIASSFLAMSVCKSSHVAFCPGRGQLACRQMQGAAGQDILVTLFCMVPRDSPNTTAPSNINLHLTPIAQV